MDVTSVTERSGNMDSTQNWELEKFQRKIIKKFLSSLSKIQKKEEKISWAALKELFFQLFYSRSKFQSH